MSCEYIHVDRRYKGRQYRFVCNYGTLLIYAGERDSVTQVFDPTARHISTVGSRAMSRKQLGKEVDRYLKQKPKLL